MNISQEQLIEILKEIYLKGHESETLQTKDFITEIEKKFISVLEATT